MILPCLLRGKAREALPLPAGAALDPSFSPNVSAKVSRCHSRGGGTMACGKANVMSQSNCSHPLVNFYCILNGFRGSWVLIIKSAMRSTLLTLSLHAF